MVNYNNMINRFYAYTLIVEKISMFKIDGHEYDHSARVAILVEEMAKYDNLSTEDINMLMIAGIYHDSGRVDDTTNNEHGIMGANNLIDNNDLDEDIEHLIAVMIEYHAIDDNLADLEMIMDKYDIDTEKREHLKLLCSYLKDADALDRVRFEGTIYDLKEEYLRTEVSHLFVPVAKELYNRTK